MVRFCIKWLWKAVCFMRVFQTLVRGHISRDKCKIEAFEQSAHKIEIPVLSAWEKSYFNRIKLSNANRPPKGIKLILLKAYSSLGISLNCCNWLEVFPSFVLFLMLVVLHLYFERPIISCNLIFVKPTHLSLWFLLKFNEGHIKVVN